jgi:hypothetical protein
MEATAITGLRTPEAPALESESGWTSRVVLREKYVCRVSKQGRVPSQAVHRTRQSARSRIRETGHKDMYRGIEGESIGGL